MEEAANTRVAASFLQNRQREGEYYEAERSSHAAQNAAEALIKTRPNYAGTVVRTKRKVILQLDADFLAC
jgi:hypothetical protein